VRDIREAKGWEDDSRQGSVDIRILATQRRLLRTELGHKGDGQRKQKPRKKNVGRACCATGMSGKSLEQNRSRQGARDVLVTTNVRWEWVKTDETF